MNKELIEALTLLEQEKGIAKDTMFDAIENSLMTACKKQFEKAENVRVEINRETGDFAVLAEKEVVETRDDVMDDTIEIALEDAVKYNKKAKVGEMVDVSIQSKEFGRIAAQNAKQVIVQKIKEEEKEAVYNQYHDLEKTIASGFVRHYVDDGVIINLGRCDAILKKSEMIDGEKFKPNDRIKVYILEVKKVRNATKIYVSRSHPEFVKRLFETEVVEIQNGTVEIKGIAREAGSRTKMAVYSENPNIDPTGACVGKNGDRVNAIVDEIHGEKIDIFKWDEDAGTYIANALAPAKITVVFADPDEKTAKVVVPDHQLSLAIGKEGQNARLAAKLTNFKIDIKSETQAKDAEGFRYEDYEFDDEDADYEEYEEYDEESDVEE